MSVSNLIMHQQFVFLGLSFRIHQILKIFRMHKFAHPGMPAISATDSIPIDFSFFKSGEESE
jgi:hypothetical protein